MSGQSKPLAERIRDALSQVPELPGLADLADAIVEALDGLLTPEPVPVPIPVRGRRYPVRTSR